jgi:hypothetical protein
LTDGELQDAAEACDEYAEEEDHGPKLTYLRWETLAAKLRARKGQA